MAIINNVSVPYENHIQLVSDSAKLEDIKTILTTKFEDDKCQLIAVKSILGIVDEEEVTDPADPVDP